MMNGILHITDRVVPVRAIAVLPPALQMRRDSISPRRTLPTRVCFGPVQGIKHKISLVEAQKLVLEAECSRKPLFLLGKGDNDVTSIDVSDRDKSNWMCFLPLGTQTTANVWLYEKDNELYGITTERIKSRIPMALGYSREYALEHGIPEGQPVLELNIGTSESLKPWWCYVCQRALPSAKLLQRHNNVLHKEEKLDIQRKYRCRQCSHTFSRLFTLKRHMSQNCVKAPEIAQPMQNLEAPEQIPPDQEILTSQIIDDNIDNRLPSDESLQNYTNNLDFSTSLFDTDRMPNLDISGSSRSETDFNYSGFKDDLFANLSNVNETNDNNKDIRNEQPQTVENAYITCQHCYQLILKGSQRQHLRLCPGQRHECECGQVFIKKEKLAKHIHTEHPPAILSDAMKKKPEDTPYKCMMCDNSFKRRGMLVNHMWRVHNSVSCSIPLERRVRHYPCVACSKLYRSATKRNRHIRKHHPGIENVRGTYIEGGSKLCQPAECPVCPRQYATHAKMMQHFRKQHPQQVPAPNTKNQTTISDQDYGNIC